MSYSNRRMMKMHGFGLGQGDVPAVGQELGIDPRSQPSSNGGRTVPTMWLQRALNASGVPSPLLAVDNNAGSSDSSHTMVAARTWASRNGNRTPLPQRTDDPGHVVISNSMEAQLSLLRRVADPTGSTQTGWLTPTERGTPTTTPTTTAPTTTPTPTLTTITAPIMPTSGMPIWPFAVAALAVAGLGAWFMLMPAKPVKANRRHSKRVRRNSRRSYRPGTRWYISEGSGSLSNRWWTIIPWSDRRLKFDHEGIPRGVPGAYSQPDRSRWVAVVSDDGQVDMAPKGHLRESDGGLSAGPGRPGQRFTHGDVEVTTTLHEIGGRVRRNARQNSPVPGLSEWRMSAGGTSALPGTHGYSYKHPDWVTEYHIWAPTRRGGGYTLAAFAVPGIRGHWSHHGPFKTPQVAARYARQLATKHGVQERAAA